MSSSTDNKVFLQEIELNDCACEHPVCDVVVDTMVSKLKPAGRAGNSLTFTTIGAPYGLPNDSTSASKDDYIVMIGGSNCKLEFFNDIWIYHVDSQTWFPLRQSNSSKKPVLKSDPPAMSPRSGHVAVSLPSVHYSIAARGKAAAANSFHNTNLEDEDRLSGPISRIMVIGGQEVAINHKRQNLDITSFNDMWLLELHRNGPNPLSVKAKWVPISPTAPKKHVFPALNSASAVYYNDTVFIFGGANDEGPSNATYAYNVQANTIIELPTTGDIPSPREMMHFGIAPVFDNAGKTIGYPERMGLYVWGGRGFDGVCGDMYCLDLTPREGSSQPPPIAAHSYQSTTAATASGYVWRRVGPSPMVCAAASTLVLTSPLSSNGVGGSGNDKGVFGTSTGTGTGTGGIEGEEHLSVLFSSLGLSAASTSDPITTPLPTPSGPAPHLCFLSVGGSDNDAIVSDVFVSQPLHTYSRRETDAAVAWAVKLSQERAATENQKNPVPSHSASAAADMVSRRCAACGGVRGWQRLENIPNMDEFLTRNSGGKSEYKPGDDVLADSVAVNRAESPYYRMAGAMCAIPTHGEVRNGREVLAKAILYGGTTAESDRVDTLCFYVFAKE